MQPAHLLRDYYGFDMQRISYRIVAALWDIVLDVGGRFLRHIAWDTIRAAVNKAIIARDGMWSLYIKKVYYYAAKLTRKSVMELFMALRVLVLMPSRKMARARARPGLSGCWNKVVI